MFMKASKKWYFTPIIIYLIYVLLRILLEIYIQPITLGEDNTTWTLKSKSFKLKVHCSYIGGDNEVYRYKVISQPHGLLDEVCYSATDLLLGHPVGMVFGNFDFDGEKELLVLGCEGGPSKSAIPGLVKNISKYYYYQGYYEVMGYYDFRKDRFEFKRIKDSPFSGIIKGWYIEYFPVDGNLIDSAIIYGILALLITLFLAGVNKVLCQLYRK